MVLCELRENSKVLMCFRVTLENVGLGSIYILRKGVLGLFRTTYPTLPRTHFISGLNS